MSFQSFIKNWRRRKFQNDRTTPFNIRLIAQNQAIFRPDKSLTTNKVYFSLSKSVCADRERSRYGSLFTFFANHFILTSSCFCFASREQCLQVENRLYKKRRGIGPIFISEFADLFVAAHMYASVPILFIVRAFLRRYVLRILDKGS